MQATASLSAIVRQAELSIARLTFAKRGSDARFQSTGDIELVAESGKRNVDAKFV